MSTENKRVVNRYFVAVLYPQDENYKYYLDFIMKNYLEVTYITHNKDVDENGEIKKEHTHVLFKVGENARHLNAIAKEIGIPGNYLQGCNKTAMLRYLIHLDNPNKTQYKIEEVKGVLKNELKKIIQRQKPEEDRYNKLIIAILNGEIKTLTQLMIYAIRNNLIDEVRKTQFLLTRIIEEKWKQKNEHNITN